MITSRERILIMGAGGRDFHVFNTCYRNVDRSEVVAFTATQIPHIDCRSYPPVLAGALYPDGIPIHPEADLESLIKRHQVDNVVFAYSDVSLEYVDAMRDRVARSGARFSLFQPEACLLRSSKPCVAICAVRTGCGKSPVSRHVSNVLREAGWRPAIIRHPMPYGNLAKEVVQRFESVDDLARAACTIEEMEEYEPHILAGDVVFAGADYEKIVAAAEAEADILIWDGGNNDPPFIRPDLLVTLLDPLRAGDECKYFPGTWNFEHADVLVVNKLDQASPGQLALLRDHIQETNPNATIAEGELTIQVDRPEALAAKRVLVIEDGPTTTHGGMSFGAGYLAANQAGAAEIVDPRRYAVGELAKTFAEFPHLKNVLPALGYAPSQIADLEATIRRAACDIVVVATPIDLGRILTIDQPTVRVTYQFEERDPSRLRDSIKARFRRE